jgi:hypothetical protein
MELDEMKLVWSRMNEFLESQRQHSFELRIDQSLERVRTGLRPLYWGQILQIGFGFAMILLAVSYWSDNVGVWYRLVTGLILHVYGIAVIMMAGITIGQICGIDYAEPVISIRRRIARLSSTYILNGLIVGLPWWVLWVLVIAVLASFGGVDLLGAQPIWILLCIGFGGLGLMGTWIFHRWSHAPSRADWGKRLDANAEGASLNRAQRILEELREFELEAESEEGCSRS